MGETELRQLWEAVETARVEAEAAAKKFTSAKRDDVTTASESFTVTVGKLKAAKAAYEAAARKKKV